MQVIYTTDDFTFASQELMIKHGSNREKKFVEYYRACDPMNAQHLLNTHSHVIRDWVSGGRFDPSTDMIFKMRMSKDEK